MIHNLNFDGTEYPAIITYSVLKNLAKDTKSASLVELDQQIQNVEMFESILWYSLIAGHRIEKKHLDLKRDQMEEFLDYCLIDFNKMLQEDLLMIASGVLDVSGKKK